MADSHSCLPDVYTSDYCINEVSAPINHSLPSLFVVLEAFFITPHVHFLPLTLSACLSFNFYMDMRAEIELISFKKMVQNLKI